jgi:hypothetical protein
LHALFQSVQHLYEKREGSGSGAGFVPLTNGPGSGRPKNMWIRIPNTANNIMYRYGTDLNVKSIFPANNDEKPNKELRQRVVY